MKHRHLILSVLLLCQAALLFAVRPDSISAHEPLLIQMPELPPLDLMDTGCEASADSLAQHAPGAEINLPADSISVADRGSDWWTDRIRNHTFSLSDTTIIYPRFLKFCVNAYNWADRVFNTYDHEYVVPTGKKWKALIRVSNWTDSYSMTLDKTHVRMLSDIYSGIGPSISFMAVGMSYQANLNRLISHVPARQKRYDFSFSCALFWVNVYYSRNRDGTEIRQIGHYTDPEGHRWIKYHFPDLQLENYGLDAYYFFNHGKYYHGAAYNYSKIQRQSQGSLLAGIAISHQDISLNLTTLPDEMQAALPADAIRNYRFNYNDFGIIVGYGYNWVFHPKWVWNITGMGVVGYKHSLANSIEGRCERASLNFKGRSAFAYNLRNFFAGVFGSVDLNWYKSKDYSFANAIVAFGAVAGIRF